jgi:hypothetical protein
MSKLFGKSTLPVHINLQLSSQLAFLFKQLLFNRGILLYQGGKTLPHIVPLYLYRLFLSDVFGKKGMHDDPRAHDFPPQTLHALFF